MDDVQVTFPRLFLLFTFLDGLLDRLDDLCVYVLVSRDDTFVLLQGAAD